MELKNIKNHIKYILVGDTCCNSYPCQNGGICSAMMTGGYTCACTAGYTGVNCQTGKANYIY